MNRFKKILMVQLYSNGDCLYTTTIAKQIKFDFPNCHLTWAISSSCRDIIKNNPYVDSILDVSNVIKNDVKSYRKFKKNILSQKKNGIYDYVFFFQILEENLALYDGCIRSNIFNAYPNPITVDITPIICLSTNEIQKANEFAEYNNLKKYKEVILFEFAPQSGQVSITYDNAIEIAEKLTCNKEVAVIMSSAQKINTQNNQIIDGSFLTIRETVALMNYCTFLLGTSSGITWLSTSNAGKKLPMIQILNPDTKWVNPISRDFERFNISDNHVIEILEFNIQKIVDATKVAIKDFNSAKVIYNQPIKLQFNTTRTIIYNLLCYLHFKSIYNHISVNRKIYGNNYDFFKQVILSFVEFPIKLIRNFLEKTYKT